MALTGNLGYAHALSGRIAEGIPLLKHALSASETMGFGDVQPRVLVHLGEACVLAERLENALELAGRALTLARKSGQRGDEAWALRLLGDVTAHRDSAEHAERHYDDALALAAALEIRPVVAHCHFGLGTLYRRSNEPARAEEHVATAAAMYREMDMGFWLKKAESELGPQTSSH